MIRGGIGIGFLDHYIDLGTAVLPTERVFAVDADGYGHTALSGKAALRGHIYYRRDIRRTQRFYLIGCADYRNGNGFGQHRRLAVLAFVYDGEFVER